MTLLFDLDNTLLDDRATKDYYLPRLYHDYNQFINCDLETFSDIWVTAIPKYYQLYAQGKLTFQEQREKRIKEAFNNEQLSEKQLFDILECFDRYFSESWRLFPGWVDFLNSSRLKRAIVTNGSREQQNAKIDKLKIRKYFDNIYISGELGMAKPDPSIFQYVCDCMHVRPEESIFIGDSWSNDIEASSKFGMKAFWINHFGEEPSGINNNIEIYDSVKGVIKRLDELELILLKN